MNRETARKPKSAVPNSGLAKQLVATIIVATTTLNGGMVQGWVSPVTNELKSSESPVGAMGEEEIAFMASLIFYSNFIIAFFFAFVAKKFGRKHALICTGVLSASGGAVLMFAANKTMLYLGRALSGFTIVGGVSIGPMYVSEIVHSSIRGMLISLCAFEFNVGILISYAVGKFLNYRAFNFVMTLLPIVYTTLIFWLPETPHFFVAKSRLDDAEQSLLWFRAGNSHIAKAEVGNIQPAKPREKPSLIQALKIKGTKRALIICTSTVAFQTLSGIHIILNFCNSIFEEAGSPLSPGTSSILTAGLIAVTSLISCTLLIDKFGRKPLLYTSFVGTALSLSAMAIYLYARMKGVDVSHVNWVPIASMSAFVIVYALGLTTVPSVLTNELSTPDTKPVVAAVASSVASFLIVIIVQGYPYLNKYIGSYFSFLMPAIFNVIGVFFTWCMVPETKGRTQVEIFNKLNRM